MTAKSRQILLFSLAYFVSYVTRINYGAIIPAMESATGFSKTLLSMAPTGSFVTYAIGQIVSGLLGDRLAPKKLVTYGLAVTVFMNLLIPVCSSPYQMLAVWCVNGFAQAFMWPPLVKLMVMTLTSQEYKTAVIRVSWSGQLGTMAVYLFSPLCLSFLGWKFVFLLSALCGVCMLAVWVRFCRDAPAQKEKKAAPQAIAPPQKHTLMSFVFAGIIAAGIFQGMLRDGVTTWMPSYIADTYHFSNIVSTLTGVVFPIFGLISVQLTAVIYHRKFTNPVMCVGVLFGFSAAAALALAFFTGKSAMLSVLSAAVLTAAMSGIHFVLTCMLPPFFERTGNIAAVSGILNSCTYVGSALSTYGVAVVTEQCGWSLTVILWLAVAVLGAAVCFFCVRPWRKKMEQIAEL